MDDSVAELLNRANATEKVDPKLEASYDACKLKNDRLGLGMMSPGMLVMLAHLEDRIESSLKERGGGAHAPAQAPKVNGVIWADVKPGTKLKFMGQGGKERVGKFVQVLPAGRLEVKDGKGHVIRPFAKRVRLNG